jgi:transcriptional regulator with XRE-family HTH domain
MKSDELRRLRRALGYSQPELAAFLSVAKMTVSRWERGVHRIPESVAMLIRQMRPKQGRRK